MTDETHVQAEALGKAFRKGMTLVERPLDAEAIMADSIKSVVGRRLPYAELVGA